MEPRAIPEIREADEMLQHAEKGFPTKESAQEYFEAFEILNDYLEAEKPAAQVSTFIENIKFSYAKATLTRLNEINTQDFDIFFHYFVTLVLRMKPELEKLRVQFPNLGDEYDACKRRFKPQLDEIRNALENDA